MTKKRKKKKTTPKIELTPEEKVVVPDPFALTQDGLDDMGEIISEEDATPELSETPVIDNQQANADVTEPLPPSVPVTCSGCKATVDSSTVTPCLICPRSLVFCPACAKAKTCHKCGKKLDPNED
ncbi:hypothetical protein LCGC14_0553660 [marine sediment metagenome]|uniref:Uncharacterized protein n=1 Tax=marine sediment metagenome TaxID=412755 RepID=A0A0F9UAK5_9ZZZZ